MFKNKKIFKVIGFGLLLIFLVIQFFHTERNQSNDFTTDISKTFPVSDSIRQILKTSCDDCHSNASVYPWYANIQPVAWWLQNHIDEGKDELNFSEFGSYRIFRQYKKLEEIEKQLKEDEMPLPSYLIIHRNSKLSASQKQQLLNWAQSLRDLLKNQYPADSLVNPKKREKRES